MNKVEKIVKEGEYTKLFFPEFTVVVKEGIPCGIEGSWPDIYI
jgi:hypothetical protein